MRIAIVAAMDKEIQLLLGLMSNVEEYLIKGQKNYKGEIAGHQVLLSECGIGKVNSALRTYQIIEDFKPELVINSGVAGGADISAPIGTVLVADRAAYHDVWCGPGTEYGTADSFEQYFYASKKGMEAINNLISQGEDIRTGLIATGDTFISTPEEIERIKSIYPDALACDMESASISQTCTFCNIPFMIIRVISDMPGKGDNVAEYQNFWKEAPVKTFHIVEKLLHIL